LGAQPVECASATRTHGFYGQVKSSANLSRRQSLEPAQQHDVAVFLWQRHHSAHDQGASLFAFDNFSCRTRRRGK
jgi:hypothetical protein